MINETPNAETDTMTTRTDIHNAANLKPEDYKCIGWIDLNDRNDRYTDLLKVLSGERHSGVHETGQCDHCGNNNLRYVGVFKHYPTSSYVGIGSTCAVKRMGLTNTGWKSWKRELDRRKKNSTKAADIAAWQETHSDLVDFFASQEWTDWTFYSMDFLTNISRSLTSRGRLSVNQVKAARKAIFNGRPHEAKSRERNAQQAAERATAADCPTGRMEITGEIVKVSTKSNEWGTRFVMVVKDDRGFAVWGTQPDSIQDAVKGDRVTFTATVSPSDQDAKFGFFKRPVKAECLTESEPESLFMDTVMALEEYDPQFSG